MKSRSAATQGSPNEFGWLAKGMLHRVKSHRDSLRDPANRVALCASASLAAQQKFDCAQDDIQGDVLLSSAAKAGDQWSPLRRIIKSIVGATIGRPPSFAIAVCFREPQGTPLPVFHNSASDRVSPPTVF